MTHNAVISDGVLGVIATEPDDVYGLVAAVGVSLSSSRVAG